MYRHLTPMLKFVTIFMVILNSDRADAGLTSSLQTHLINHETAHVMLVLKHEIKHVVNSVNSRRFVDFHIKAATLVRELREFTKGSQKNVLSFLGRREPMGNVKPFWITNKISVRNATLQMLQELMAAHGDEIDEIREAVRIPLVNPAPENIALIPGNMRSPYDTPAQGTGTTLVEPKVAVPPWGVANIHTAEAHQKGYRGQGVVVAVIDSGVRRSHESLKHNMRPTYNWFDAQNSTDKPIDDIGHGTHCTGTAVGFNGYGVAPGSQWIACRIFADSGADEDVILLCAQWVTCPSLPDGSNEDCSMRPHVTSNSWGGPHSDFFNDPILTWEAVKIIPVFAIGNSGPACRSAGSPGDQDKVISVGATNFANNLAYFSSRGPSGHIGHPKQKPDVCAPGERIMSTSYKSDKEYLVMSGTSMATPHVAGTVALLLSKRPTATFDDIKDALQSTAWRSDRMMPSSNACKEGLENVTAAWPNNLFGKGIIRADAALDYL